MLDPKKEEYWTAPSGCPRLFLAPMEGVADSLFRQAISKIGGFDEACTEFIRVSRNVCINSIAKKYNPHETYPIPQAAQLMGDNPITMAQMTKAVVERGAHRVDLNCGCPSNKVTGRGAGSSLLRDPSSVYAVAHAMVEAVDVPVTVKLRSGFADTSLFKENLLAAQESGVSFITLHPRTKVEGYSCPAHWNLIREAKELLDIPVVGSGDILNVADALRMRRETGCDGLMIGRGALINPWIFHQIHSHYRNEQSPINWQDTEKFLRYFSSLLTAVSPQRGHINKLKQIVRYLFKENECLTNSMSTLLRRKPENPSEFLEEIIIYWRNGWKKRVTDQCN